MFVLQIAWSPHGRTPNELRSISALSGPSWFCRGSSDVTYHNRPRGVSIEKYTFQRVNSQQGFHSTAGTGSEVVNHQARLAGAAEMGCHTKA
jgi:hypothetical protein